MSNCSRCGGAELGKRHGNLCQWCHLTDVRKRYENNKASHQLRRRESRRKLKEELILHKGTECEMCGYEFTGENHAAFDFHHINPKEKEGYVLSRGNQEKNKIEVEKCMLVCSNCHRILHSY